MEKRENDGKSVEHGGTSLWNISALGIPGGEFPTAPRLRREGSPGVQGHIPCDPGASLLRNECGATSAVLRFGGDEPMGFDKDPPSLPGEVVDQIVQPALVSVMAVNL